MVYIICFVSSQDVDINLWTLKGGDALENRVVSNSKSKEGLYQALPFARPQGTHKLLQTCNIYERWSDGSF